MQRSEIRAGDRVRAFHPGRFGVVDSATVVSVGSKYARLDFGPLLGGIWKVSFAHIVELAS